MGERPSDQLARSFPLDRDAWRECALARPIRNEVRAFCGPPRRMSVKRKHRIRQPIENEQLAQSSSDRERAAGASIASRDLDSLCLPIDVRAARRDFEQAAPSSCHRRRLAACRHARRWIRVSTDHRCPGARWRHFASPDSIQSVARQFQGSSRRLRKCGASTAALDARPRQRFALRPWHPFQSALVDARCEPSRAVANDALSALIPLAGEHCSRAL
jgi:hypothetical protein